jgi:polysaccharide chain length determinant protein (PEP-CTERM system associated)
MKDISQQEIKKYLSLIYRKRYLFIAVSLLCLSIAFWSSFFTPKMFEAKSTVFIEKNILSTLVKGLVIGPSVQERLRILRYSMMTRYMLLKVIDALDLDIEAKSQSQIESMIKNYQKKTKINIKGNDLFDVSYSGQDPKLVRDYVNTLISTYIEENAKENRRGTSSAKKFLTEQINFYKKKLDKAEEELMRFRNERKLYFVMDEDSIVSSIRDNREEIKEAELEIKRLEGKKEKLKKQLSGEEPLILAMLNQEQFAEEGIPLNSRLKMLERSLPMLFIKYNEEHPEIRSIKAEIEVIKEQIEAQAQINNNEESSENDIAGGTDAINPIYQKLKEDLFDTESEIDALKAKSASLINNIESLEKEMQNIPGEKKKLLDLQREKNTLKKIYMQLLSKIGQAEVTGQMEVEDKGITYKVVDPAILPTHPINPERIKLIIFGLFIGIGAGFGAVFLLDYFDDSIKDVNTLKSQLGIEVLAVIPKIVTEKEVIRKKRIDRGVYAVSITYLLFIGSVLFREIVIYLSMN